MARPGEKITRKTIMMQNKMKELDLKEKSSKSLLANVLDMDDDFVPSSSLPHSHLHHQHSTATNQTQTGQQKNGGFIRLLERSFTTLSLTEFEIFHHLLLGSTRGNIYILYFLSQLEFIPISFISLR